MLSMIILLSKPPNWDHFSQSGFFTRYIMIYPPGRWTTMNHPAPFFPFFPEFPHQNLLEFCPSSRHVPVLRCCIDGLSGWDLVKSRKTIRKMLMTREKLQNVDDTRIFKWESNCQAPAPSSQVSQLLVQPAAHHDLKCEICIHRAAMSDKCSTYSQPLHYHTTIPLNIIFS